MRFAGQNVNVTHENFLTNLSYRGNYRVEYDSPEVILQWMAKLEGRLRLGLKELEIMLR
jgi:hypothetical protein